MLDFSETLENVYLAFNQHIGMKNKRVVCSDAKGNILSAVLRFGDLRADCLESMVTSGREISIYSFGYPRASRRRLKFVRHSTNVFYEEFVLSGLSTSPLIKLLFTPRGWHEVKWVYWKVSVVL